MPEYIEREAFKSKYLCCGYLPEMSEEEFDNFPAADVAPVVHGRWGDNDIPGSMLCGCSVCGFTCGASSFFYCPNCGAKMDGEPCTTP